jgi:hypothetical protein
MANGPITHIEFPADDVQRAKRIYAAVAGWEFQPMEGFPDNELFATGDRTGGAIGARGSSTGNVVRVFITIPDLEAASAAATGNGGQVIEGPADVPGQGRYVVVLDPEGDEIALWQDTTGG